LGSSTSPPDLSRRRGAAFRVLLPAALLLATYGLGIRLFATISPTTSPDRAGFYTALALATSIGPYLYTRFYIPDILLALWMTLAVHLFLVALDRIPEAAQTRVPHVRRSFIAANVGNRQRSPISTTPGNPHATYSRQ